MYLIKENDVYKRESEERMSKTETITFKQPQPTVYTRLEHDWYMVVALKKADLVKEDRHLLTGKLLIAYRNAIRIGYNHATSEGVSLDPALNQPYDYPRNRNTINGIQGYIDGIKKKQDRVKKENGFID